MNLYNNRMQLTIFLAHKFASANCLPTLRDKIAADAGVMCKVI